MKEFKAPAPIELSDRSIFLAGSIEMGKAEKWQETFTTAMAQYDVLIYNPRRDDWDLSWKQTIDDPQFNEQVNWELNALDNAELIVVYIDPNTTSPITLMELGLHANDNIIVCCPEGFYRKGNVDIVCAKYHIKQVDTLEELIAEAKENLQLD